MIIAYTSAVGHGGILATNVALAKTFSWSTLKVDVYIFVKRCIHCMSTTGGNHLPHPLESVSLGTKPNDLFEFDHTHMGLKYTVNGNVFIVRNDRSG